MSDLIIGLKVQGDSPQQIAYALFDYYVQRQDHIEMAIIDLEELAKHILTSVEAETKRLTTPRKWVADSE